MDLQKKLASDQKKAKKLLKSIVDLLNENNEASKSLWDVLTALRGPDDNNGKLKDLTTTRIRGAIGMSDDFTRAIVSHETPGYVGAEPENRVANSGHFRDHYMAAYRALPYFDLPKA